MSVGFVDPDDSAERIEGALREDYLKGELWPAALARAMADILHLCDAEEIDVPTLCETAKDLYYREAEQFGCAEALNLGSGPFNGWDRIMSDRRVR